MGKDNGTDAGNGVRRRGRPTNEDPEAKRQLLRAARDLMSEQPSHRVSLRAIADRAGCDAALINYYFGGKSGLLRSVLADAAADVTANLKSALESEGSLEQRLQAAVAAPIHVLAGSSYLSQLIMEQLILSHDNDADDFIQQLAAPYLRDIIDLVEEGIGVGDFRSVDPRILVYTLSGLPLFFYLLAPIFSRIVGGDSITSEGSEHFAAGVTDLILHGTLVHEPDPPETDSQENLIEFRRKYEELMGGSRRDSDQIP